MGKSSGSIWVSLGLKTAEFQKGIKKAKGQLNGFQKFGAGLKGMFNPMTVGIGVVAGLGTALTNAARTIVEFEKANSKLEAITRSTSSEMKSMSDQAKELGSSTSFTATQVTELQTEFAKLGFPTNEILQMTAATLDGAAALGSDLASQAALTGAVLKQYGLDAGEAAIVNDVMAEAAASSALDFEKLNTALPIVGATAGAAGVSFERTTALLGTLSDRGLDASSSGTALRNVFLELSKTGLTYEQAMAKINTATDKNAAALDLFGKRGATAGVILAESGVSLGEFEQKLNDANGAAKIMAQTMLDDVAGDITIAESAWTGFILSIEDGTGVLSKLSREVVQLGTTYLGVLTSMNNGDIDGLSNTWLKHLGVLDDTAKTYQTASGKIVLSQEELVKASQNSEAAVSELKNRFNEGSIDAVQFQRGVEMLANGFKRMSIEERSAKEAAKLLADENQRLQDETDALAIATELATAKSKKFAEAQKKSAIATQKTQDKIDTFATSLLAVDYSEIGTGEDIFAGTDDILTKMTEDFNNKAPKLEVPITLLPPTEEEQEKAFVAMAKLEEKAQAAGDATAASFDVMGSAMVDSMIEGEGQMAQFSRSIAKLAINVVSKMLGISIANAIRAGTETGASSGPAAAVVTPTLIGTTVASVVGAFAQIAFADGGLVTGPTMGLVGEGVGTTKTNPEVIAPLDKLKSFIGGEGGGVGNVVFKIEGSTLVGILKREGKSNNYSN